MLCLSLKLDKRINYNRVYLFFTSQEGQLEGSEAEKNLVCGDSGMKLKAQDWPIIWAFFDYLKKIENLIIG